MATGTKAEVREVINVRSYRGKRKVTFRTLRDYELDTGEYVNDLDL